MNGECALVVAALGVGDIIRVTPIVRLLHRQGFEVDFAIAPDFRETATLFTGAPEIRRLIVVPADAVRRGSSCGAAAIAGDTYAVAVLSYWASRLQSIVRARQIILFDRARWIANGDPGCAADVARALGWQGELPPPFAVPSARRFDLPEGTVALHPGCKHDWPWKKWHGFDELARLLPSVAVVGTAADLDNAAMYFGRPFVWPVHARNFAGQLSLADTAALIAQSTALVSNDSGLMHLGAALGTPTFGIFGLTSPRREALPLRDMVPVTKGLPCEPACRRQPWGRRDCDFHVACLRALTAEDVRARMIASGVN